MEFEFKIMLVAIIAFFTFIFGIIYTNMYNKYIMADKGYIYIQGWYPKTILKGIK